MEIIRIIVQIYLQVSPSKTDNILRVNSVTHQQPHEVNILMGVEQLHRRSSHVLRFFKSLCACHSYNNE